MDHLHNLHATPHWFTVYPKEHYTNAGKTQLLLLVNRHIATDTWSQEDFGSSNMTAVQVRTAAGKILIVNMYSDNTWQAGMKQVAQVLHGGPRIALGLDPRCSDSMTRQLQRASLMWDESQNVHLLTHMNLDKCRF